MPNSSYRFEDFRADFDAVGEIGVGSNALVPSIEVLGQYFQSRYKNPAEAARRMNLCFSAFGWWQTHREDFEEAGLGVVGEKSALVKSTAIYVLWALWREASQPLVFNPAVPLVVTLCREQPKAPERP
jgi:hypothetical protein